MINRLPGYFDVERFGIKPDDVVQCALGCAPEQIRAQVVITPIWNSHMGDLLPTDARQITPGRVFEIDSQGGPLTLIRSGVGAPLTGDVVLALGCTPCETLVFTGSVGGLDDSMTIGDLVLVERSVIGDGFSRYLSPDLVPPDPFLRSASPDQKLTGTLREHATRVCRRDGVRLHEGTVVSVDTIIAQFIRLDYMANHHGCVGIEMETSATFSAASLVGIRAAALLQLSDVIPAKRSLFAGRTQQDTDRRRQIRRSTLP